MPSQMTGRDIIANYVKRLSMRPEYYSGRGATSSDLNSAMLEDVYKGVRREYGEEAAQNFCQLVYDLPSLPATTFLNTFYTFVYNGCVWSKDLLPKSALEQRGLDVGPDHGDGNREAVGLAILASAFGSQNRRDETEAIRGAFLYWHRGEFATDPEREKKRSCSKWGFLYDEEELDRE